MNDLLDQAPNVIKKNWSKRKEYMVDNSKFFLQELSSLKEFLDFFNVSAIPNW